MWSTFFAEIGIKPTTESIFLVPGAFTVTDHNNFVNHFELVLLLTMLTATIFRARMLVLAKKSSAVFVLGPCIVLEKVDSAVYHYNETALANS